MEEESRSVARTKERVVTEEIGREREEREWRRVNQMEGISNDHHGREARWMRCNGGS